MPTFNQMNEGKYLKKDDFPQPALLTIKRYQRENVAKDNDPEEHKWIVYFHETEKGLVLNSTNLQLLQLATGSTGTEDSLNKKVVLFNDPTISFGGKLTGGIRIRAPRNQAAPAPVQSPPAPAPEPGPFPAPGEEDDTNVPF